MVKDKDDQGGETKASTNIVSTSVHSSMLNNPVFPIISTGRTAIRRQVSVRQTLDFNNIYPGRRVCDTLH